jgi:hypothetical protein
MNTFEKFLNSKEGRKVPRIKWADRFEVSPSFVAHLVSGKRQPGLSTAYRIEIMTGGKVPMQSWIEDVDDGSLPLVRVESVATP